MKFLEKLYPTKKQDELKLLATINTTKELKQLAEDLGMTKEQIKKTF
jgi:DNA-binding phage protein